MPRLYGFVLSAAVVILVSGMLVFAGYRFGQRDVQASWDADRAQVNGALVALSLQYAAADAEASRLRTDAQALSAKRLKASKDAVKALPPRDCGLTAGERRVLVDAYCERFPAAATCGLPGPVRVSQPAAGGGEQPGAAGVGAHPHE